MSKHQPFILLFAFFLLLSAAPVDAATPGRGGSGIYWDTPEIDARVQKLIGKMTLEEKVGQLSQYAWGHPDPKKFNVSERIATGGVGSFLNLTGARACNEVQRQTMEKSRLKIPILFALDVIHGYRTIYPMPLGLSAAWNPDLAERCARMAAVEASSEGIRWTFSPMVDIARDARWGRIAEGNGEDPYLGGVLAAAWVRGYQGKSLADPTSMVACAKHFACYGAGEGGRDYNLADVSEGVLHDVYLPPFQSAVEAGVGTLMTAFNTMNGVPGVMNNQLLSDILRGEWGFRGFVVSDDFAVKELLAHGVALDAGEAAGKAVRAGTDMDMDSDFYNRELPEQVRSGKIPMKEIDRAVACVLRLKFALGLFDRAFTEETLSDSVLLKPEHINLVRQAAEESFVLLKNAAVRGKPLLPLGGNQTVALIGSLADSSQEMLGGWSGKGKAQDVVNLRQTLSERLKDKLVYAEGCGPFEQSTKGFEQALAAANQADVVLMALGESRSMSSEARSRSQLGLPGNQLELLQRVVATGKPVVLILFNGRPLALPWEAEHVPAILEAWFPGLQAGPALVRTLYGEVNPVGKLTASFPRSVGQMPLYYNTLNTGRPGFSEKPQNFLSGYFDEGNIPLFPFGWGLSYTKFDYSPTTLATQNISVAELNRSEKIVVEADVKNTGGRVGTEVVELYINQRGTSAARPVRELKGFQRITLAPGESKKVRFEITKRELSFWHGKRKGAIEPGELTVWVSPNAKDGVPAFMQIIP